MIVLEFLSLTGGCKGSSESTHFKMPHCWESHALAHIIFFFISVAEQACLSLHGQIHLRQVFSR